MKNNEGKTRATLVEYAPAAPILHTLSSTLGIAPGVVTAQIVRAGERVSRTLALPTNPFTVGESTVRVTDVAGLLRVSPRLELEIAPKFLGTTWPHWREDFFFLAMLSRHGRLLANERLATSVGERHDLAILVARAMISMFWENNRRPLRSYHHVEVTDFVIDGEVDPESIMLPLVDGYTQRILSYDHRNVFNSAILAASVSLLPEVRHPQTRSQLLRVAQLLAPQTRVRLAKHRRVPNRAKRWQSLHDLAIDVLRGFGVAYDAASMKAPGFVLHTWRVWEDLLTVAVRLSWGSSTVHAQRPLALGVRTFVEGAANPVSRTAWVIPDIDVTQGAGLLIDAKYKGRITDTRNRISEADLYEALAFASAAHRNRILLLYPAIPSNTNPSDPGTARVFERVSVRDVAVIGMEIEVRGISQVGALTRFAANIRNYCEPFLSCDLTTILTP